MLMLITLTNNQNKIKNEAVKWYKSGMSRLKPIFVIAGVAGSGKSTLLKFIIDELNLQPDNIAFTAYTGMAANVLIRKGHKATTIHKLIYDVVKVKNEKTGILETKFKLKERLPENIKLIVVDEVSMVSEKMMNELMSFGLPILALGDPFQLPPIMNNMCKALDTPDGMLNEPLRQALDNPIIWFSNQLRHKIMPAYGQHGDTVHMYHRNSFPEELLINADQILAGKNDTVKSLNTYYRTYILGKKSIYPTNGEKLICLKNNWDLFISENNIENFLVNGLMGYIDNTKLKPKTKTFSVDFMPTYFDKTSFKEILGDALLFNDSGCKDDKYIQNNYPEVYLMRKPYMLSQTKINKFDFGYTITVYKSQGSEFNNVLYYDEMLRRDLYYQHFYTAVTRAKETLNIIK